MKKRFAFAHLNHLHPAGGFLVFKPDVYELKAIFSCLRNSFVK